MKKKCTQCGIEKDASLFYKEKRAKDSLTSACKSCLNEKNRLYRKENAEKVNLCKKEYIKKNKEKFKKYNKKYAENNKDKIKKSNQQWRDKNKEHLRKYHADYRKKNRDKLNSYQKDWAKNNPDKIREKTMAHVNNLSDHYVRSLLAKHSPLTTEQIPVDMIEIKRLQILIQREIRK